MDFGQQRQQNQQNARSMMYQNTDYDFERRDKKTLILDVANNGTLNPLSTTEEFSVDLFEPLIIDKLSDIYLDSFMTHDSMVCHTGDTMAFSLQINEFNVNSNSASTTSNQHIFNRIIIPNDHTTIDDVNTCVVHKGKKLNYVCSINPSRLSKITGKVTDLGGLSIFNELASPKNSTDGGKLHYVSLTTGASQHVDKGSLFGWDAGATPTESVTNWHENFSVAFDMQEGATDLYFHAAGKTATINAAVFRATSDTAAEISKSTSATSATGLDGKLADASTYKVGDFPRFIAEFVIVARE